MPAISFLACRMFEDEIIHIIENDSAITSLLIVENEDCKGLVEKLESVGISYELSSKDDLPSGSEGESAENLLIVVEMLELALHAVPDNLKKVVYQKVIELSEHSDGILLFYGLCGNVLGKIEDDLKYLPCPVHILKEDNGDVIDDCIGAALGGRAEYLEKLKGFNGVGTFFMTPVWAAHWREMLVSAGMTPDPDDIKMSKFVFDYAGYKNVAKMDTGLYYEKQFGSMVEEFAQLFDFNIIEMKAGPQLLVHCYEQLKTELMPDQN